MTDRLQTIAAHLAGSGGGGQPAITTHVLDTSRGSPAEGIPIILSIATTTTTAGEEEERWKQLSNGVTNKDGRCPGLLPPGPTAAGIVGGCRLDQRGVALQPIAIRCRYDADNATSSLSFSSLRSPSPLSALLLRCPLSALLPLRPFLPTHGMDEPSGRYRLRFNTAGYHAAQNIEAFFPYAELIFDVRDGTQHYHVPLLLSPFAYSTYRGS